MAVVGSASSSFLFMHGSLVSAAVQHQQELPFTNRYLARLAGTQIRVRASLENEENVGMLLSRVLEQRRVLSLSHRTLMTERRRKRRHLKEAKSIDVGALLPIVEPRSRILEETISSDASDFNRITPRHHQIAAQTDMLSSINRTYEQLEALPTGKDLQKVPLPVCNLNSNSGLASSRVLPIPNGSTGFVRARPMTEAKMYRDLKPKPDLKPVHSRPTSLVLKLDVETHPPPVSAWNSVKHTFRSSIAYIEDMGKKRKQTEKIKTESLQVSPQLRRKQRLEKMQHREQVRKSVELHGRLKQMEANWEPRKETEKGGKGNIFDVRDIVHWTSGANSRLMDRAEQG